MSGFMKTRLKDPYRALFYITKRMRGLEPRLSKYLTVKDIKNRKIKTIENRYKKDVKKI